MTFWRLKSLQEIIIYTFKNTLFWKPCFGTTCFGNLVLGHPVFETLFWDNLFTKFEKLWNRPGLGYTKLIACIEFGTSIEYKYTPGNSFLKKIEKSKLVTVFTIIEPYSFWCVNSTQISCIALFLNFRTFLEIICKKLREI